MLGSINYIEYLVATLTVQTLDYAHITTFTLLGVVTGVLSAAAGKTVLG